MAPLRRRDRGQLLLTGAFVVAVLLVGLAVALNSAIVTSNRGTYGSDVVGAHEVHQLRADTAAGVGSLIHHANRRDGGSYDALVANLSGDLARWETLAARHEGLTGGDLTLGLVGTTNGTRIVQTNATRPLTNASGTANWTLVSGSGGLQAAELRVDGGSLAAPQGTIDAATLNASDAARLVATEPDGDRWAVFVYAADNASDDVFVSVAGPAGTLAGTCRAPPGADGTVRVDLSGGTVGGGACEPLDAFATLDADHDLAIHEGASAAGSYSMVVDRLASAVDDGDFGTDGSTTAPYATGAIYGATVSLGYTTPDLAYRTNLTVGPGDRDG